MYQWFLGWISALYSVFESHITHYNTIAYVLKGNCCEVNGHTS